MTTSAGPVHTGPPSMDSFERARPAREGRRYARCSAGVSSLSILANGDVVPCVQVAGARPEVQGNVRVTPLKEIWRRRFEANRARDYRCCGCHRYGGRETD